MDNTQYGGEGFSVGKRRAVHAIALLAFSGSLLLLAMFVTEVRNFKYIGLPTPEAATIAVEGDGEAYGAPDLAQITFDVTAEAKTVAEAQKTATEHMSAVLAFLKDAGVEEKDIKTTGYNFYPKYEWQQTRSICPANSICPPEGKQVLTGYEVSQSVDVKIRKIDDAGKILGGLGEKGATNVSGLTFKVEKEDDLKAQARAEAIAKAKDKADKLAKDLGVSLVRIVSYNEGGSVPMYNFARSADAGGGVAMEKSAPPIPAGENKFVSNVTIVYEVK